MTGNECSTPEGSGTARRNCSNCGKEMSFTCHTVVTYDGDPCPAAVWICHHCGRAVFDVAKCGGDRT